MGLKILPLRCRQSTWVLQKVPWLQEQFLPSKRTEVRYLTLIAELLQVKLPPQHALYLFQALKEYSTDESPLQQISTLGFLGIVMAQYHNHLQTSPADTNILLQHVFFLIHYKMSLRKESKEEHQPGLPVESWQIKTCSLRKQVNPLQHGSVQEAVRVRRR